MIQMAGVALTVVTVVEESDHESTNLGANMNLLMVPPSNSHKFLDTRYIENHRMRTSPEFHL